MEKIAFFIPSLEVGGAERIISILANKLSKKQDKYNVFIYLLDNDNVCYDISSLVEIKYINFNENDKNPIKTIKRVLKIRKALKKDSIDIVVSFLTSANFLAILSTIFTRKKVIVSERSDPNRNCANKRIEQFRNYCYKFADGIVCQTNQAKDYFPQKIQKKIKVLINPVKENLPIKDKNIYTDCIVTAVRLQKSKNLELLLSAFSDVKQIYPNLKLHIYGDGPEKKHLMNISKVLELNPNEIFLGSDLNWHQKEKNAVAFVLSSNYEGMSNSLIEAMVMGIPTISTDHPIGGARYFIKNNINGILIEVNNRNQLKDALIKIISDAKFRDLISEEGKKIFDLVNIDKICFEWELYLNQIMNKGDIVC